MSVPAKVYTFLSIGIFLLHFVKLNNRHQTDTTSNPVEKKSILYQKQEELVYISCYP